MGGRAVTRPLLMQTALAGWSHSHMIKAMQMTTIVNIVSIVDLGDTLLPTDVVTSTLKYCRTRSWKWRSAVGGGVTIISRRFKRAIR